MTSSWQRANSTCTYWYAINIILLFVTDAFCNFSGDLTLFTLKWGQMSVMISEIIGHSPVFVSPLFKRSEGWKNMKNINSFRFCVCTLMCVPYPLSQLLFSSNGMDCPLSHVKYLPVSNVCFIRELTHNVETSGNKVFSFKGIDEWDATTSARQICKVMECNY